MAHHTAVTDGGGGEAGGGRGDTWPHNEKQFGEKGGGKYFILQIAFFSVV